VWPASEIQAGFAMAKVVWPWVNLAEQEISLPPGIVKNRKPLIVPSRMSSRPCSRRNSEATAQYSRRRISGVSG